MRRIQCLRYAKNLTDISQNPQEKALIIPVLKMRTLKLRDMKKLA